MGDTELTMSKHPRGEATRKAILAAAEQVFADVGYEAARMEDVAQVVGIRRPSIVYHFPSKQDLYDAVESDLFEKMHAASRLALKQAQGPLERLLALLDAWLDYIVQRPTAARILQRLVADVTPRHGNPVRFSELALSDMDAVIEEGVRAGCFRPINTMLVINGVSAATLFYVCNGRQLGDARAYSPSDPDMLREFRALLHRTCCAAVLA